ncbi:hypothetical protein ACOTV8_08130 [Campylobacter jejuni]|uniref:hypothetical protein n=1 Tax=Campylobacter jejuni TaxID=197 RepID=UPI0013C33E0F|nr:hypothetical protein [Campylobacter jejuni]MBX1045987.1 hypothetical protein [Campylobacter jejuni]HEH3967755.1 hypothetical protein [Campylobacter jejuni]
MRLNFIFILLFSVLFFSACSTKNQGKYDDFFNDQSNWIPINSQNNDLKQGQINEK